MPTRHDVNGKKYPRDRKKLKLIKTEKLKIKTLKMSDFYS